MNTLGHIKSGILFWIKMLHEIVVSTLLKNTLLIEWKYVMLTKLCNHVPTTIFQLLNKSCLGFLLEKCEENA
jgi:hypothetical protein